VGHILCHKEKGCMLGVGTDKVQCIFQWDRRGRNFIKISNLRCSEDARGARGGEVWLFVREVGAQPYSC
jgi:hypothetical protein